MFTKKLLINKTFLLIAITFVLAALVRFYNFENRINFGPEQAISLITSAEYIKVKPSLLGQPNVQRITSQSHTIFTPVIFNYSLVPLLLIFNFDPVPITGFFAFLNITVGLTLFWVINRIFNAKIAFFSIILFLFNDLMIYHSLFIWPSNYIPLLFILIIYFLWKFWKKKDFLNPFLIGLLSSFAIAGEYYFIITALIIYILILFLSTNKFKVTFIFLSGLVLGNLPTLIFDIKHSFYHIKTLWQYLLDTIATPSQGGIDYYHYLHFWPVFAFLGAVFINFIFGKNRLLAVLILIFYILLNLNSSKISFSKAMGMSEGLNITKVQQAAQVIADDHPQDFNVAQTLDFDSRGHQLRYFLRFKYLVNPKGVEDYKGVNITYALAKANYDFDKSFTYEVTVNKPYNVTALKKLDENYWVYKLTKLK